MASSSLASPQGRCLITGILGFTGVHLARELREAGYEIVGLASPAHEGQATEGVLTADLTDLQSVRAFIERVQPDIVIHLAAIAFVAHGDVDTLYRTNVVGTRNLLQALAEMDNTPRAVLLASSANIYGNTASDAITEDMRALPENDYAVSKLAMEYMAWLWQDRLPITIVRPFNYTGVGQSLNFLIPKIVDHFRRGAREIELGNLDVARDFSDVRMVVAAYRRLIELPGAGQIYNVCSGTPHALGEVIDMLQSIAGYRIAVKVNPAFVRANEIKRLSGSPAKLTAAVGALPAIPLADTLGWMYRA